MNRFFRAAGPFVALLLALVATACSGLEAQPPADAADSATPGDVAQPRKKPFRGHRALVYERSYRICSAFSVKEIAHQHHVRARPRRAARAHAKMLYKRKNFKPAFVGCLDAFKGHPRQA